MSSYNSKFINNTELINSFNQPMSSKMENLRINNEYPLKIKKVIPLFLQGYKNAMSIKAQYLNNNLKKILIKDYLKIMGNQMIPILKDLIIYLNLLLVVIIQILIIIQKEEQNLITLKL